MQDLIHILYTLLLVVSHSLKKILLTQLHVSIIFVLIHYYFNWNITWRCIVVTKYYHHAQTKLSLIYKKSKIKFRKEYLLRFINKFVQLFLIWRAKGCKERSLMVSYQGGERNRSMRIPDGLKIPCTLVTTACKF